MERRKPSNKASTTDDQLALVKAAAWAWFERGSGLETRSIQEFDNLSASMPRKRDPKPSRYKLEAMRNSSSKENPTKTITPPLMSPSSTVSFRDNISEKSMSNLLLDDYEIERISKQLDLYIESSRAEYLRSTIVHGEHPSIRSNKVASLPESGTSDKRSSNKLPKTKKSSSSSRGFWPFRYAAICGSKIEDVVNGRSFKVWRRQLFPEKDVTTSTAVARKKKSSISS